MPTYEYECETCGHVFEEFQSMTAEPLTKCPREGCGGKVHRLLSGGAGFLFKGDGFYITDYRSDSYKKSEKADKTPSSSGASSDSSSSKSTDTKSSSSTTSSSSSAGSSSKSSSGSSPSSSD